MTKMEVTTSLALALSLALAFVFVLVLVLSLALAYVPRRLLAYVPRRLLHFVQRTCTWLHGAQPRLQACRPTGKKRGGRQRVRSFFQMAKNAEAVEAHRLCQAACHAAQIVREDAKTLKSVMASSIISASKESEARRIGNVRRRHGGSGGLGDGGVDEIPSAARKQIMFVLAAAAAAKAVAISMAVGARAERELTEAKQMELKCEKKQAVAKAMELKYHQGKAHFPPPKAHFPPPPFRPVPRPPQSCRTSSTVAQCGARATFAPPLPPTQQPPPPPRPLPATVTSVPAPTVRRRRRWLG